MPKVVESKLVVKGDDQASAKLDKITASIERIGIAANQASQRLNAMMQGLGGGGVGVAETPGGYGRGRRGGTSASRSPNAPGIDTVRARGGTGYGGKPWFGWRGTGLTAMGLGIAARTPSMAAHGIAGAASGGGLEAISGMMGQLGGGITGAFGGFGAIVGLPLLMGAAMFGIGRSLAEPGIQYGKASYGSAARLSRSFVEAQRRIGVKHGISPMEMAQYLPQLEKMGAERGFGAMAGLREYGITPETSIPLLGAITKAGGAGRRGEQDYESIKRALLGMSKDTQHLLPLMDALLTATESMSESLGDIGQGGTLMTMNLLKWMQGSPSMALQGVKAGQLVGNMAQAIATPGAPGKEMFLWGTLARIPGVKAAFRNAAPYLSNLMPEGPMTQFQMRMLRETPEIALPAVLNKVMGQKGVTPYMLMEMFGMRAKTAGALMEQWRTTGGFNPEDLKAASAEMKPPEASLQDIAKHTAHLEDIKTGLLGPEGILKVLEAEKTILEAASNIVKGKAFQAGIDALPKLAKSLESLSKGEFGEFFRLMGEAVETGVRAALGFSAKRNLNPQQYEAEFLETQKNLPQATLEGVLANKFGWDFAAPNWVKEWVKNYQPTKPR